jgi:predicted small lipoprotein YifL
LRYAALIAILALFALAACGSEEEPDPGEFVAEANSICLDTARQVTRERTDTEVPQSPAQAATVIDAELPARIEGLSRLQALEPPEQLASNWVQFVALQEQRVVAQEQGLSAAQREDDEAFADYQLRFERLSDDIAEFGVLLGLDACAELLPPAGQRDVAEAVEKLLTSFDSERVCSEAVTERFIDAFYGNVQNCIDTRPAPTAVSLKLLDSGGVASTYAFVDVEVTDFRGEKRQIRVELTFVGDAWRVDYRQPLSEPGNESLEGEEASAESP